MEVRMALNPLEQFFSKVGARDVSGALAVIDDATVFEPQGPESLPIYGRFVGKGGVERLLGTLAEQFETERFEIREWAEAGDYVFAYGYMQHRVRKTGRIFKSDFAVVAQIEGNVIRHYRIFEDTAAAVAAFA
ncbi:TPA: nuclear transport factor 2 family protein [Burkholderia aenigmatica]|nr:nuclear transport factor 2 family protein [Burkholderia aenigmatica]HDR9515957.1 nuclear transport factor 2 family protein [Burkholderia aenigmatica]HDR9592766.1 nuclear transport factor 2 family protein [Burkholderia aenigmatica]HDR9599746.1 nuclear transport factor 2 family protein [Burkholderia aenigmatica]HDR9606666.1 nuclear transport factor 2 family protein [Burkholderia aenigmatica]